MAAVSLSRCFDLEGRSGVITGAAPFITGGVIPLDGGFSSYAI